MIHVVTFSLWCGVDGKYRTMLFLPSTTCTQYLLILSFPHSTIPFLSTTILPLFPQTWMEEQDITFEQIKSSTAPETLSLKKRALNLTKTVLRYIFE